MKFKFFSGFSLENEEELFKEYIIKNDFTICGFSYGAIKAFKYVLNLQTRIDLIQLFSPAFFQNKEMKFKRMQLMFIKKDKLSYCKNFLQNISYPSSLKLNKYFKEGSFKELEELLFYEWKKEDLQTLINNKIKIEVYLGFEDKIINSNETCEFFKEFADVYYIKNVGHILQKENTNE